MNAVIVASKRDEGAKVQVLPSGGVGAYFRVKVGRDAAKEGGARGDTDFIEYGFGRIGRGQDGNKAAHSGNKLGECGGHSHGLEAKADLEQEIVGDISTVEFRQKIGKWCVVR